ncbi:hypothetical protein HYFRA_00004933 [Hymenoscyphus fraxineus]|uniref:Rhodopsin domain-containing protein n=1 Tax=Hymenoscyphus fraxineus TaxID=746836 RepID=A0A9N9KNN6_9HELO|nr:hypothetical protein HYFRA_00004933 [Hymenoscyphus fraxineus]
MASVTSLRQAVVAVSVAFPILAALAIAARFRARQVRRNFLQTDDYMIVLSWCVSTGLAITYIVGVYDGGIGYQMKDLDMHEITVFTSILFAGQFLYLFSVGLVKISIVLFYKKIFATAAFVRVANAVLVVLGLWITAFFFATLFQAWPIKHAWTGVGRNLIDYPAMYLALGSTDLVLDIIILLLPIPMIKNLNIQPRRKFILGGILGLGFLCIIASAVRIKYLRQVNYGLEETVSEATVQYIIWSQIEASWSIVCACLPTLRPLFKGSRSVESIVNSCKSIFRIPSNESLHEKKRKESSTTDRSLPKSTNSGKNEGVTEISEASSKHKSMRGLKIKLVGINAYVEVNLLVVLQMSFKMIVLIEEAFQGDAFTRPHGVADHVTITMPTSMLVSPSRPDYADDTT